MYNITIVVGYKKDYFIYAPEKFKEFKTWRAAERFADRMRRKGLHTRYIEKSTYVGLDGKVYVDID